jgi:hypothetical protein
MDIAQGRGRGVGGLRPTLVEIILIILKAFAREVRFNFPRYGCLFHRFG